MTMEAKQLQKKKQKINAVKKKIKRVRKDNSLSPYVKNSINKPTKIIWDWIKEKFCRGAKR